MSVARFHPFKLIIRVLHRYDHSDNEVLTWSTSRKWTSTTVLPPNESMVFVFLLPLLLFPPFSRARGHEPLTALAAPEFLRVLGPPLLWISANGIGVRRV